MQDLKPANVSSGGGKKKSNGHKGTCKCPICKNMAKKGGSKIQALEPASIGGGKKSNGHKGTCKCPICVNMKHQQASKKNRRVTRGKRTRRGGIKRKYDGYISEDEEDDEEDLDLSDDDEDDNDEPDNAPDNAAVDNAVAPAAVAPVDNAVAPAAAAADDDGLAGLNIEPPTKKQKTEGGRKKGNGHKPTCKCPICKNMKKSCSVAGKSRKTRRRR